MNRQPLRLRPRTGCRDEGPCDDGAGDATTRVIDDQVDLGGGQIPTATSRFDEARCEHMTCTDVERAVAARAPGAEERRRRATEHRVLCAGVCTATLWVMTSQRAAAARSVGCTGVGSADLRSAGRLAVDLLLHAAEIARFRGHVVRGPTASDCDIWTGAIGAMVTGAFISRATAWGSLSVLIGTRRRLRAARWLLGWSGCANATTRYA